MTMGWYSIKQMIHMNKLILNPQLQACPGLINCIVAYLLLLIK